ncbi:tRNA(Cytosine32)-2-thiocytidine synthetase [Clostridiaceae bacterium JG1575]|nr:tRNA(Cytosine32)-2-thiocytidine synthetase [Clostridiaceae bacterium JG1575]
MEPIAGSGCERLIPKEERGSLRELEASLTKKYKKAIWSKFTRAINDFQLLAPGDRVAVAVSGGKDSLLMAKLFQELKKHRKFEFEVVFLCMDPGYHPQIRELLWDNVKYLNIPLELVPTEVFSIMDEVAKEYPCYLCARMRRGHLYHMARERGCNKLALGHHFDDVIETVMLNLVHGGTFQAMPPKLRSDHFPEIELIRPLYYVAEADIKKWTQSMGLWPLNCACMVAAKRTGNQRYVIKELIESMRAINPNAHKNLLKATENVYRDTLLGYVSDGVHHHFEEVYAERPSHRRAPKEDRVLPKENGD